jgi:hypothetical protein
MVKIFSLALCLLAAGSPKISKLDPSYLYLLTDAATAQTQGNPRKDEFMFVYGSGFSRKSILMANGKTMPTHFINKHKLRARILDVIDRGKYLDDSGRDCEATVQVKDRGVLSNGVRFHTHRDGNAGG